MKKLITGVLLSACIATTAYAGGKHSDERRGQGFFSIHKMAKVLELTDEQKAQFKALKEELKAERKAKKEEMADKKPRENMLVSLNPDDADYQEKLNALADKKAERAKARFLKMAEVREKISDILTDEQLEKFDEMAHKQGRRGKKHHRHG